MTVQAGMLFFTTAAAAGFANAKSLTCASASKWLSRTQGTGTSRRKMTFSVWVKTPASIGGDSITFFNTNTTGDQIYMDSSGITVVLAATAGGFVQSTGFTPSASTWYHVLVQLDTANATAGNRCKIYIDAVDRTGTPGIAIPINTDTGWGNNTEDCVICAGAGGASWLTDEVARFDNQTYASSSVRDGGTSKPIDLTALTFGNEGHWIRFETGAVATIGTDSSGLTHTYTNNAYVLGDFSSTVP